MAERRSARDVVDTVLGFARTLRHAGVAASPDRVEAMLAALGALDVLDPTDVYWAGRLTLCGGPDDLDRYDAAFAAYFAGEAPRPARRARAAASRSWRRPRRWSPAPARATDDPDTPDLATQASADEVLRHRDVAEMSLAERDHLRRLFALLRPATPMRPGPAAAAQPAGRGAPGAHGAAGAARRRRGDPAAAPPPARRARGASSC